MRALNKMSDDEEKTVDRHVPMFNKNAYSSNGAVVVTTAARMVMAKNRRIRESSSSNKLIFDPNDEFHQLTKAELHAMRCVVNGLRLLHRDRTHIKEVLSHCITEEVYGSHEHVVKKSWETQLSCHFILSGTVMVNYDVNTELTTGRDEDDETMAVGGMEKESEHNPNEGTEIVYTHGAGEYLCLLSLEGIEDDIAPPSKIFTLEPTEFLRIDKEEFHSRLDRMVYTMRQEIKETLQNSACILSAVPDDAMDKIIPHISKQHYSPQHTILKQGEESNVMFCIAKGRCDVTRSVVVPEAKRRMSFYLGPVEQHDCFGQECLIHSSPSLCTVTSTCSTLVLKINRQALQVVVKDHLVNILDKHFHGYPSDEDLRHSGYQACVWSDFKHLQVKQHLVEAGGNKLLLPRTVERIKRKPMTKEQRYRENLRSFILHGANFKPVTTRVRSAYMRRPTKHDATAENKKRVKSAGSHHQSYKLSLHSRGVGIASSSRTSTSNRTGSNTHYSGSSLSHHSLGSESDGREIEDQDGFFDDNDVFVSKDQMEHDTDRLESWRAAVLVTLKTKDIVKKAKAAAEKHGRTGSSVSRDDTEKDGRWHTSIHEEHDRLSRDIARDKQRTEYIRRYLDARASQRQCIANDALNSIDEGSSNNNDINNNKNNTEEPIKNRIEKQNGTKWEHKTVPTEDTDQVNFTTISRNVDDAFVLSEKGSEQNLTSPPEKAKDITTENYLPSSSLSARPSSSPHNIMKSRLAYNKDVNLCDLDKNLLTEQNHNRSGKLQCELNSNLPIANTKTSSPHFEDVSKSENSYNLPSDSNQRLGNSYLNDPTYNLRNEHNHNLPGKIQSQLNSNVPIPKTSSTYFEDVLKRENSHIQPSDPNPRNYGNPTPKKPSVRFSPRTTCMESRRKEFHLRPTSAPVLLSDSRLRKGRNKEEVTITKLH